MTTKSKAKKALGRRTTYTDAIGKAICKMLSEGVTLTQISKRPGMPGVTTILAWAMNDKLGFYEQYARAREIGYQRMADQLIDIADDGRNDWEEIETRDGSFIKLNREATERSKLRVDTRKWLLSKALPKIYGEKVDVKHEAGDSFKNIWAALTSGQVPGDQAA